MFDLDEYVYEALPSGASGFVIKRRSSRTALDAMRVVTDGEALLSPAITKRVIKQFARIPRPGPPLQLPTHAPHTRTGSIWISASAGR